MLTQPTHSEMIDTLITALEDELYWLTAKQYASEPQYQALLDAIHNLPDHPPHLLADFSRELLLKFQDLSNRIGEKFKSVIDLSISQVSQLHERMGELEQEIQTLRDQVEGLEYNRESLKNRVVECEEQLQNLKSQASEMQAKYEIELRKARKEKKEIKRTFLQVQEDTEQERRLIEDLHLEKLEITQQILNQKQTKESLLQEIALLRKHLTDSEKKASASASKIQYEERQIQRLQQELEAKNKLIEELYQSQRLKIDEGAFSEKDSNSGKLQLPEETPVNGQVIKKASFAETFRLGEEVLLSEGVDLQFRRSSSAKNSLHSEHSHEEAKLNNSIIQEEMESSRFQSSRKIEPVTPDIYFCHFLLTVQSVKLKMNMLEVLDIDLANKHHYLVLLEEGVPFHHWDSWIEQKLRSLASLNR